MPTVVNELVVTLELNVFPTSALAGALEVTPVNCEPLPINNPELVILPVAVIMLAAVVPSTVTPVPETTTTLATLALLMLITLLSMMLMLLVPFEIPDTPPILNSSVKFSLVLINAVRSGSPSPSLATLPTLITCCVIFRILVIYLPKT